MESDYGVSISPRALASPLWVLSPRALRLWMYLAMKADHAKQSMLLPDGQRVTVERGQWLTSTRRLEREAQYRTHRLVIADLGELAQAGTVTITPIRRGRFRISTSTGSESAPVPVPNQHHGDGSESALERFRISTTGFTMATLISVNGIKQLQNRVVPNQHHKEKKNSTDADASCLSERDRRELARADRQLTAEGR